MAAIKKTTLVGCVFTGMLEGAVFGHIQTCISAIIWRQQGEPDFWFRGGFYAPYHLPTAIIGFAILSIPYGIAMWIAHRLRAIRAKPLLRLALVTLLSTSVAPFYILNCFHQQQISNLEIEFYGILFSGGFLSSIFGKKIETEQRDKREVAEP